MSAPDTDSREWTGDTSSDRPEQAAETGAPRPTPGDPALKSREKEEIDRYVDWQHDPDVEYLKH